MRKSHPDGWLLFDIKKKILYNRIIKHREGAYEDR